MIPTITLPFHLSLLSVQNTSFIERARRKLGTSAVEHIEDDLYRIYLRSAEHQFTLYGRDENNEVTEWIVPEEIVYTLHTITAEQVIELIRLRYESWLHRNALLADWRGGMREGAGRPDEGRRIRQIIISDEQWEFLRRYGGGNASAGARNLIDEAREDYSYTENDR